MDAWANFFLGELGAAAALAGLLFVSVSVNQARILTLGRMADRGLEALLMLLLVIVVASLGLTPGQPLRVLGTEIAILALALLAVLMPLQRGYLNQTQSEYRSQSARITRMNQAAIAIIGLSGAFLVWRGDTAGLYWLVPGVLLTFAGAGANAWVLLVEINR